MTGQSRNSVKWFVRLAVVLALVPVLNATTCPPASPTPPAGDTTLFSGNLSSTAGSVVTITPCTPTYAPPVRGLFQTFNALANKLVTVQVNGPTVNSRAQIQVQDALNNQVANTGNSPSVSNPSVTFTPATSNLFILRVQECADIAVGSIYAVSITQAP